MFLFTNYLHDSTNVVGVSIKNYVSQVRVLFTRWCRPSLCDSPLTSSLIHRLEQVPRVRHHRDPAPVQLVASVLTDDAVDIGVRMSVALMWAMCARSGDVLATSVDYDAEYTLLRSDITFKGDDIVQIHVPHSKADHNHAGSNHFIHATGGPACAVSMLRRFMTTTSRFLPSSALLVRADNGKPVLRQAVVDVLKRHAEVLGLSAAYIGSHSLRIGAATTMIERGLSIADVMLQGNWASQHACLQYMRHTVERARLIASALAVDGTGFGGICVPRNSSYLHSRARR